MSGSWPRAWRLILARLHHDNDAAQIISDEVGECPNCWRGIADELAGVMATEMVSAYGWDKAVAYTEGVIEISLDAVEKDRKRKEQA
jgi:hypothetical protein